MPKRTANRTVRKNNPIIEQLIRSENLRAEDIELLKSIEEVGFYNVNREFSDMKDISALRYVTFLVLYDVHVSMTAIPQLFPIVKILYISYSEAKYLPQFSEMQRLEHLQLKAIEGMDFVYESIAMLPALRNLVLKRMPSLMAIPIANTMYYPSLIRLKVSGCPNMISYCEHMYYVKSMQSLIIYGMKGEYQNLQDFDTLQFPPHLRTLKLRYLNIAYVNNENVNCFPLNLYRMPLLSILSMRYCYVGELPQALLSLGKTLQTLSVSYCKLRKIPMYIRNMIALRIMILSHNELVDLPYFENCPKLVAINFSVNNISHIDDHQFSRISHIKSILLAYNRLQDLPFPRTDYPKKLQVFTIFDVKGNLFPPTVLQFINNINRYNTRPEILQTMVPPKESPLVVSYEKDPSEQDIHGHVMLLTNEHRDVFENAFPQEHISPYCAFCLVAFTADDPPFVCKVYYEEAVKYLARSTASTVEQIRRSIPQADIHRHQQRHYNHVMHEACFKEALGKFFVCPELPLCRFELLRNLHNEEDEEEILVRSLKMIKFNQ